MQLALVPCLLRTPLVARSAGATMLLLRALTASGGNALWPGAVTLLSASPGAAAPAMMQCMQHAAHARGLAAEALGTSTPSTSGASSSTSSSTEEWYFGDRPYYESEATRKRKLNLQYCQQRAAWRREMTVLRKQWTAEWRAERQREEERARQLKEEAAQLRAQRDEGKQRDRGLLRLEREIRDAERTVELARARLQRAERQVLRAEELKQMRAKRREHLEEESSSWIPQEKFAERLEQALDHPQSL